MGYSFAKEYENRRVIAEETVQIIKWKYIVCLYWQ